MQIIAWDIGGANVKAARQGAGPPRTVSLPFEIWRARERLPEMLRAAFSALGADSRPQAMAVTMTAELSDAFAVKREGVRFVLASVCACFPDLPVFVLSLSGDLVPVREAESRPLECAGANWMASALWAAGQFGGCVLLDVGSTTSDIIPILDGRVQSAGRTDFERLAAGELVYTGALRTNVSAIVRSVPVGGRFCPVASEYFATSGDAHLLLGRIRPEDYTCPTPDGRPATAEAARGRIARLVCADAEMLSAEEIDGMARHISAEQVRLIRTGLDQVLSRLPVLRRRPAVVLGSGSFLAAEAARLAGLEVRDLAEHWGRSGSAAGPCLALAQLLAQRLEGGGT